MKGTALIVLASAPSVNAQMFRRSLLATAGTATPDQVCQSITTNGCTGPKTFGSLELTPCQSCSIANPTQCYSCNAGSSLYTSKDNTGSCFATCGGQYFSGCMTPTVAGTSNGAVVLIADSTCNTGATIYPISSSGTDCTSSKGIPSSAPVPAPCPAPAEDKKADCFSGSDTVTLETGASKALSEVEVGDRVLSANARGEFSFSEVVFLPHGSNDEERTFVEIATSSGKQLKATKMHLMQACDGSLAYAGSLKTGSCLRTIDGDEVISSLSTTVAKGIYTAVTKNEFLVVGGVVASPFAVAHSITHAYYNIHRALYELAPSVVKSSAVLAANALMGSTVALSLQLFSSSN